MSTPFNTLIEKLSLNPESGSTVKNDSEIQNLVREELEIRVKKKLVEHFNNLIREAWEGLDEISGKVSK